MKRTLLFFTTCFIMACGSGDIDDGYHTTDAGDLNPESKNVLNNTTPVNDDSIGGVTEQTYIMDSNSINTAVDTPESK